MFCPTCGTQNDDRAAVCTQCGNALPQSQQPQPVQQSSPAQQPPPGQQPVMAAHPAGSVPTYLVRSILVTIFCCWPLGIPAIVNAARVNSRLAQGDYNGALQASRSAKKWSWIALALGLVAGVIWVIFAIVGGALSSLGY